MKSMRVLALIVFAATIGFVSGCEINGEAAKRAMKEKIEQARIGSLEHALTIGNHTYIPLNFNGTPEKYTRPILNTLKFFEQEHPELEVTSWSVGERYTYTYIYGLWVNHRPRSK